MNNLVTRVIDVLDFAGHEWKLRVPPLRWNKAKTEMWLRVTKRSGPNELRNFPEIPVPCFTDWFVPVTFCGCDEGYTSMPCLTRDACDARRLEEI